MSKKYTLVYFGGYAYARVLDVRTDKFLYLAWDGRSPSWEMYGAFDDR
jgi:hypothetical protein